MPLSLKSKDLVSYLFSFELDRRKPVGKIIKTLSSPFRILPEFLIIGGQRCGSTYFYNCLKQHPNIKTTLRRKEIHFFDNNFNKGILWYKSYFPTVPSKYANKYLLKNKIITGEASPYYLLHPLVPSRVHSLIPNVKLIILVRNPVDRAYSHYKQQIQRGNETLSFREAIDQEKERLEGEINKIISNELQYSSVLRNYSYLTRGVYINQIRNWTLYFSKDQFLIIKSEDFFKNPQKILNKTFKFLNLPSFDNVIFKKPRQQKYQKMDTGIRFELLEFFKLYNYQLYDYLGVKFDWEK